MSVAPTDSGEARLRAVTRGSALALAQTELVATMLRERHQSVVVDIVTVRTAGDVNQSAPVAQLGDGAFVRGVEAALLEERADFAVHSAKDIPSVETPALILAAFPERADPRDVLVSREGRRFAELAPGARVGTGSPRRAALLRSLRPDLVVREIRGNVDTRLAKLDAGEYDAVLLAASGLSRLGLLTRVTEYLDPLVWLPPPGQGALAAQCRAESDARPLLTAIDDPTTRAAVMAERGVLFRLGNGCSTPVGAHAVVQDGTLLLRGVLVSPDGRRTVLAERTGAVADAEIIGAGLAEDLLRRSEQ